MSSENKSDHGEIVISGVAGRFPKSDNMQEFADNLYEKVDMISVHSRWKHTHLNLPKRIGQMNNTNKFDAPVFGIKNTMGHKMDPQSRMILEHAYEAILDSGTNLQSIRGSRTGVFIAASYNESERTEAEDKNSNDSTFLATGARFFLANRISFGLGLTGPSCVVDAACSSSISALDSAYRSLITGGCDAAIVAGVNMVMNPLATYQFGTFGVLNNEGISKPFDHSATGFVRADAACAVFLQKKEFAKRAYATLVYTKTNSDGFKENGLFFPSSDSQAKLFKEFYEDCNINPNCLAYIEAHATGTEAGDPQECMSIDRIFCAGRDKPLPIGSVKSNMGHSEPCSGLCSIAKVIIALENGKIPPNLNFEQAKSEAILEGRLQVVTETQDLDGLLIGVNSFGIGGSNGHTLLRGNEKKKINHGIPLDNLPRLVLWSGRTETAVNTVLDDIVKRPLDAEFIGLLHNSQLESAPYNMYRGYGIFDNNLEKNAICIDRDVQHFTGLKRPIVWIFNGMGSQWTEMGLSLMNIPIFEDSIRQCHNILAKKGLNLKNILTNSETSFENIINCFVGICAIQIGIVDVLHALGMKPDFIIGHSVGELGCAYADNTLTVEQTILAVYARGLAFTEVKLIKGSMAAIGLGFNEIIDKLPSGIEVACHNGPSSCTISGPEEKVQNFVNETKSNGTFAKEVACSSIPMHSSYISEVGPRVLSKLKQIITNPVARSSKWLSTSVAKDDENIHNTQYASAGYFMNNLLKPVLFNEVTAKLPKDALTIEIGPHALLQAIIKKSMPEAVHIGLTKRENKNNDHYFISALGKVYASGVDIDIAKLYPDVDFPVSCGTPMISPLVKWEHSENWFLTNFGTQISSGHRTMKVSLSYEEFKYFSGHNIDGRVLVPAAHYLLLAWKTLAMIKDVQFDKMCVELSDVKFLRATALEVDTIVDLSINVRPGTGYFEISEGSAVISTGFIHEIDDPVDIIDEINDSNSNSIGKVTLSTEDFYKELRLRGYNYSSGFESVYEAVSDGSKGKIKWEGNWVQFIDGMLQMSILSKDTRSLKIPTTIQKIVIDGNKHLSTIEKHKSSNEIVVIDIHNSLHHKTSQSGGVKILHQTGSSIARRRVPGHIVLEEYKFVPHLPTPLLSASEGVRVIVQLALENLKISNLKAVEIDNVSQNQQTLLTYVIEALADQPIVKPELTFLTGQALELIEIQIENVHISTKLQNSLVFVTEKVLDKSFLDNLTPSLINNAIVVSRENSQFVAVDWKGHAKFQLIASVDVGNEVFMVLKYCQSADITVPSVCYISSDMTQLDWLEKLKSDINHGIKIMIVAENDKISGVLGFFNCLRKETETDQIRCVFIDDPNAPKFSLNCSFYKQQLDQGLAINVLRNGQWGTYRHMKIHQSFEEKPEADCYVVKSFIPSDLSSLKWVKKHIQRSCADTEIVRVHYATLNFKDIMIATGKITNELFSKNRIDEEHIYGYEFSGVTESGKKVMGSKYNSLSTYIEAEKKNLMEIPQDCNWSLEEAATLNFVYLFVYYVFFIKTTIKKDKSILIHAGSGGVGTAAIRVALSNGMEVFTTVSTDKKKKFLLDEIPGLKEQNIGNSRNASFETMIMNQTKGRGVDYVLNSLAGDLLHASIRCLGVKGIFLEIGKYDLIKDTKIGLGNFTKGISFISVADTEMLNSSHEETMLMKKFFYDDLKKGVIKPMKANVFPANQIEQAFRFMASGKHIGKVLIKVRENDNDDLTLPISVISPVYCEPHSSWIIVGGLGGFGIEIADWLVIRGCRKLVLNSRSKNSNQYNAYRIETWKSYGAQVILSNEDVTSESGCQKLIDQASNLGPVEGIFNLAAVLRDALFENQNVTMFQECMTPKSTVTKNLDKTSQALCPNLKQFVVFSSISCGRGNAGQTNYGMGNSITERIIEARHAKALPGKVIQWGPIADVGLLKDKHDIVIGGTVLQKITSCLNALDTLLCCKEPIVSSIVVASKNIGTQMASTGSVFDSVLRILGIRDIKTISMDSPLSDLGLDSLATLEILQTLERDFEIVLTSQNLRSMTFQKLKEFDTGLNTEKFDQPETQNNQRDFTLLRNLGDESNSDVTILKLSCPSQMNIEKSVNCALIIPGVEGMAGKVWNELSKSIDIPTYILQLLKTADSTSIDEIIAVILQDVLDFFDKMDSFCLIGYSFGSIIAMELVKKLENRGKKGRLLLIDGSPLFIKSIVEFHGNSDKFEEYAENFVIAKIIALEYSEKNENVARAVFLHSNWEDKITELSKYRDKAQDYSEGFYRKSITALKNRVKILMKIDLNDIKILGSTTISLFRSSQTPMQIMAEDYGLSRYSSQKINVRSVEGDHSTILDNPELAKLINEFSIDLN